MLLILKQLKWWMLQDLLTLPSGILIRQIFPRHQEFPDRPAPQMPLPGINDSLRLQYQMPLVIHGW